MREEILAFKAVYVNLDTVIRICDINRLAAHGYGVTESFVSKFEKFSHGTLRQPEAIAQTGDNPKVLITCDDMMPMFGEKDTGEI